MTPRTALTVRTPDDLLACVPLVLGFLPERSAVVLSLPPGAGPHARADVDPATDLDDLAEALVAPALRHGVARVAIVVYEGLERAVATARHLEGAFRLRSVEVTAVVAADGGHWVSVDPVTTEPRPYDPLAHPFVAEAVVRGQVVLPSRGAVRDQLLMDEAWATEVARHRYRAGEVPDPAWVRTLLGRHVRASTLPDAGEVAGLLRGIGVQDGRDAAWAWAQTSEARRHVDVWMRVVRACPPEDRSSPAAVLAFHAWLAGDGALAWCAVEASAAAAPDCSLRLLVEDLLTTAAPPSVWAPLMDPGTGGEVEEGEARSA